MKEQPEYIVSKQPIFYGDKPHIFIKTNEVGNYRICFNSDFLQQMGYNCLIKRSPNLKELPFLNLKNNNFRMKLPKIDVVEMDFHSLILGTEKENELQENSAVYINKYLIKNKETVLFTFNKKFDGKNCTCILFISKDMTFDEFAKLVSKG